MVILARARIGLSRPPILPSRRQAHAAARASEEEPVAGPSNYRYRRSGGPGPENGNGNQTDRKGKGRAREQGQSGGSGFQYSFPVKGRMGGEPDPFEVMAIDRSASQSEVKKQCTQCSTQIMQVQWTND
jgi:hypothetical protein